MPVGRVREHRQGRTQRGQRQLQHALDLRGVDADRGRTPVHAEQLLRDHAAEGVADQDRLGRQAIDDARVVIGNVVDAVIGDAVRVGASGLDAVGVAGPAGRGRLIARLAEQLLPRRPRRRVQPQAMDENNRSFRAGHDRLLPCCGSELTAIVPDQRQLNQDPGPSRQGACTPAVACGSRGQYRPGPAPDPRIHNPCRELTARCQISMARPRSLRFSAALKTLGHEWITAYSIKCSSHATRLRPPATATDVTGQRSDLQRPCCHELRIRRP